MAILHNGQRLKPFLSQFKIRSFFNFVQTTSRLCVCFEANLIAMEKTGHLLHYLQSNCTLPTILNFILYYTILSYALLFYAMACYAIPYCTILYFTIRNRTILWYTHTILYYTSSIVIFTGFWGDSDCLTLKLPETGILVAQ